MRGDSEPKPKNVCEMLHHLSTLWILVNLSSIMGELRVQQCFGVVYYEVKTLRLVYFVRVKLPEQNKRLSVVNS